MKNYFFKKTSPKFILFKNIFKKIVAWTMGPGNLLSYCFPNKASDKGETMFQRTHLSIIMN